MTENEAIEELQNSIELAKMCTQNYERKREIQGYEMAIKALEEVYQYRADWHGGGMPCSSGEADSKETGICRYKIYE